MDPLERVRLGRSDLEVTRLGIGTAPFATVYWENDPDTAVATARRAIDRGIGLYDTAPFYGLGEAEERLGAALATAQPDGAIIATKAGRTLVTDADGGRDAAFDFSYDATRRGLESSLERLGVDDVHIVHIHDPDDHLTEALAGTYRALHDLRSEGVIGAISVGANAVAPLEFFIREADPDCVLLAGRFTLLDQRGASLFPLCRERGVAYIAAGVFNSGVLADPAADAWYDYAPVSAELLDRARALADVCAEHGVPLRTAALHFPFRHPDVTAVVVGMSSPAEVDDNLAALATPVPEALWAELTTPTR